LRPILARPRRDALPEHTLYLDTGCDLHPSCLACPLVRCRYDEPGGVRRLLSNQRDRTIVALQRQGRPVNAIAQRFGISRRTVFRVLAKAKADGGKSCTTT
jgi:hypothetical protein